MRDDLLNEEIIVRYLLGDLAEQRLAEVEDRAFGDRHYLQRILAAESDLIDEYVRGELSDSARQKFESRFLASAERRRKVEFARALASVVSETAVVETQSHTDASPVAFRDSLAAFLRRLSPVARLSLAAATLLAVVGFSWILIEAARLRAQVAQLQAERQTQQHDQQTLEGQVADARARTEDLASRLEQERQQRERNEELIRQLESQKEEAAAKPTQAQPAVFSIALPVTVRGGGTHTKLVLPQSTQVVRLQVGIEPGDDYKSFRAELQTQAGQPVWSRDNLSARAARGGRSIVLNLPARLLSAGQYELALKGITDAGKTEDLAYYYFDVLKK